MKYQVPVRRNGLGAQRRAFFVDQLRARVKARLRIRRHGRG
jgi:hypothetical protein